MRSSMFALIFVLALSLYLLPGSLKAGAPTTTGGTLRGIVRFEGKIPPPKPINMAADPVCAKQHLSPMMVQEVMAGGNGDLQNAIVFVSEGLNGVTFEPPSQPAVVEQKGCMYQPHVMAVRANQPVELVNDDATSHNVHPQPANNREWNKAEPPGSKMEDSFAREEVAIPVKCNVHPWMKGYIAVFKHPFFAVTGKDGAFDLHDLPAGTYTIKAWHEKLGTSTQTVTIGPNETREISFLFKAM